MSLWLLATLALGAEPPPVIALFPIQDDSGNLSPKSLAQLGDYLGVKLAESGRYRIVPRRELEAQLKQRKAESYKECVDEACQVEIGRELAAQKVLQTQIVELGGECAVTATLYDLRLAATERAASQKGPCTEPGIVKSLEAVAQSLNGAAAEPPKTVEAPPPPAKKNPEFLLQVITSPSDADVLIDGSTIGQGDATRTLESGKSYKLTIEREGYAPVERVIQIERDERLKIDLEMTTDHRASRTEWIGFGVSAGATLSGSPIVGITIRGINLAFGPYFRWALAEIDGGVGFWKRVSFSTLENGNECTDGASDRIPPRVCPRSAQVSPYFAVTTRPALRIPFGERDALEVGLGLGAHDITGSNATDEYIGFSISPSLRYFHETDGAWHFGGAVRAYLPIPRNCDDSEFGYQIITCRAGSPVMVQLEVPFGPLF